MMRTFSVRNMAMMALVISAGVAGVPSSGACFLKGFPRSRVVLLLGWRSRVTAPVFYLPGPR